MRRAKYGIGLLLSVLPLLLVGLLASIYRDVTGQVIQDLNAQQTIHARQAARGIQDHMGQIVSTLDFLGHLPSIVTMDDEGKRIMEFIGRDREEVKGVTRVDAQGRIVYSVPYRPETIGRNISGQEHVRQVMTTHKPVISDIFMTVQGFRAIAVHVPVLRAGTYDGTVAFLLSFDYIARKYIEGIRIGHSGYAWMVTRKGFEISCPIPGHVGRSVFDTSRNFPDLLTMVRKMLEGKEGATTYHFDRIRGNTTETVLKYAVYLPVPIGNTFWSIVVATPQDEVLSSMKGFRLKFLFVTLALLGSCVACTYLLVRSVTVAREQRKREAIGNALRESEALYRALLETTNTGFVVLDPEGNVVDANEEYVRMTGRRDFEEIHGRNVLEWTAPYAVEKNREAVARCIRDGRIRNLSVDYVAGEGRISSIEINGTVVPGKESFRILSVCRDVTDRKRLEDQLVQAQKMESIGRLAGGVAHDFNNMLNVINGYAEMGLMDLAPSDPLYYKLTEILKAGQRSADLTSQLLAFARRQIVRPQILDLTSVVANMLNMLQRLMGENVTLVWIPGKELWNVRIDPSQIDQILANLVVNARDAMEGAGRVTIETANATWNDADCRAQWPCAPGDYVQLTVSDSGCGMSPDTLAKIFEPFFTTKGVGEGTGLGLATVYGIVKQNGGFLQTLSEPGIGTTFRIFLPRVPAEGPPTETEAEPDKLRGGAETVLLVEDDDAVLSLTQGMLETLGYTVLTARGAQPAIALAQGHAGSLHLLITDVVMPEMNGRQLWEHLAPLRPQMRCLFMSGYTADVIAPHGVLDEGVCFLQKPFSMKALAEKVREALGEPCA